MFYGNEYVEEGKWLFDIVSIYAEFPPINPPIMTNEFMGTRKKAGGFMKASEKNDDIVAPILRPDLNEEDLKVYVHIARTRSSG